MQSRAVREGSVGLMLIAGLGVFGAIFLWLRGLAPGTESYNIIARFAQAPGIQPGGVVRFRGIRVGKIAKIEAGVNGVEVVMQMDDPNLTIPKDVAVEVSQTGLIGEPIVEITPRSTVAINTNSLAKALDSKCDKTVILCNNARVDGQIGASFNELLRRATKLVELYNNPEVLKNINSTLIKAGTAAEDISKLSKSLDRLSGDFSKLPKTVESGLNNLSAKANVLTVSLDRTSTKIGKTADKFSTTAAELNSTAAEYKKLATSVNGLVTENRKTFSSSLNNFEKLSVDLRKTVNGLNPSISKLNSTVSKLNSDKLVKDLEGTLSNANQTSANLKNITTNLNDPKTLLMLQQTLDSARSTFKNTEKITADLDELTGNAEFRANVRNLVNGLGKLVSSAEQLEQQAKLAQSIEPLGKSLGNISKLPTQNPPTVNPAKSSIDPNYDRVNDSNEKSSFTPKYQFKVNSHSSSLSTGASINLPDLDNNLQPIPALTPLKTPKWLVTR
ncbi:MlaD family protein [Chamaesiphon sp. VAR_48_metabat_135_sub]|uniref:MlaD family protein n=1 Tax=Chamaesiphon sp. VAR_48_metabat_135_sub TaxID=2964699 RepID=UPI00286C402D|nr:MlaD family protein [Chamaesiphon sp. VAR_48_metabat_135_sub]